MHVYKRPQHTHFGSILKKSGFIQKAVCPPLITVLAATTVASLSGQALRDEVAQRRDNVIAAEEAILAGDSAYEAADYLKAVAEYRGAFQRIPFGERTNQFRDAAKERYAQAAVEAARVMNRRGDREGAIDMVNEVLEADVFPDYIPAQRLRAKLDDPIRVNPAADKEHGQNIDEVRRLLYKAEGAYNLGNFDQSNQFYEAVLRIDKYNKAARRGMERNSALISDYANAARDQARAAMLAETSSAWELKESQQSFQPSEEILTGELRFDGQNLEQKLDNIIVPFVDFEQTTLEEAIEFLEGQSRALDPELVLDNKGLDFVLNFGAGGSSESIEILNRTITLRLRNVPLREVLRQVTRLSRTDFRNDGFAIIIEPLGGFSNELIVKRYIVPPSFLSQTSSSSSSSLEPFGDDDGPTAKLAPRLTAREYLEQQGVSFPDGGSASYNAGLGQLTARTSFTGHEEIRGIVEAINLKEPIAVAIDTKIVRISQENLDELGFDVTLTRLAADQSVLLDGGTTGNGRVSDFSAGNAVTAGLRSGDFATGGDPITDVLNRESREVPATVSSAFQTITSIPETPSDGINSAPGFLSVLGSIDDYGLSVLFRGLDQKRGDDSLSQPSVITRSGQQAIIESVQEFIYPTEYEPPEVPNSIGGTTLISINLVTGVVQSASPTSFLATPSHPAAFETRNLGTILEVQPTVSADRSYADVAINLRMDEFLGFINYGEPIQGGNTQAAFGGAGILTASQTGEVTSNDILQPLFDSVKLNTNVSIATGKTIVIGGLVSERVESVEDKVPILGNLPLIGRMFSTDALRREKMAVIVFVTVRIVDPAGNAVQN